MTEEEKPGSYKKVRLRAEAAEARARDLAEQLAECRASKRRVRYVVSPNTEWTFDDQASAVRKRDELFRQGCTYVQITTRQGE
jgi:hypothetical protein